MKTKWLIIVGIIFLICVFVVAFTAFSGDNEFQYPFLVLGGIQGFILIGIGEIIDHLKGGK